MDVLVWEDIFGSVFHILYLAVILTTIFVVILDNRNPVKTMAWMLILFFLPVIGLVFISFWA